LGVELRLIIDMETRSEVDLTKTGVYPYAADPSTDILCIAVKQDDLDPVVWVHSKFLKIFQYKNATITDDDLVALITRAEVIEAHNAQFERVMWHFVMHKKYGFPDLCLYKMQCTSVLAASYNLPRDLENACNSVGAKVLKSATGKSIMLKMCKPRTTAAGTMWHESPLDFDALVEYCKIDVDAEHALARVLPPLPEDELNLYHFDQIVNDRGIKIDRFGLTVLSDLVDTATESLDLELQRLTEGRVGSAKQATVLQEWLLERGVLIPDLKKDTVEEVLGCTDISKKLKRVLEIRQQSSKSSTAKISSMLNYAGNDERVRGILLFYGAHTGRWAGKGIQPQNFPRDSFDEKDVENIVNSNGPMIELLYGPIMETASRCLRGMIIADKGKDLIVADFSAIEARVLAWMAGEENDLKAFRENKDLYKVTAADIYGCAYDEVKKPQRQIGKVAVLALGYQGWVGAWDSMASNYGVNLPEEQVKEIILAWRAKRPKVVAFWANVETCAISAIKNPNKAYKYGCVSFGMRGSTLYCKLPSGRFLKYTQAQTEFIKTPYGVEKEVVTYMGVDSFTKKYTRLKSYGGKLTENITQAISRDILAFSMLTVESEGYPVVMHVHDEVVCEIDEAVGSLKQFEELMAMTPYWAEGLPLRAEGWRGKRYRK